MQSVQLIFFQNDTGWNKELVMIYSANRIAEWIKNNNKIIDLFTSASSNWTKFDLIQICVNITSWTNGSFDRNLLASRKNFAMWKDQRNCNLSRSHYLARGHGSSAEIVRALFDCLIIVTICLNQVPDFHFDMADGRKKKTFNPDECASQTFVPGINQSHHC